LHRLKGRAAFYAQNGKGGNERNILEEKKLLPRITEGNVRKTKGRGGKRFHEKYRVKKSQTEEKNILEKRFNTKKKGIDKKVKEL
jgi:hypothetical protein